MPASNSSLRPAPAPEQRPVQATAPERSPVQAPACEYAPVLLHVSSNLGLSRGDTFLSSTPKRAVDPSPIGYSYLVTVRSAVPSPRESCSLVTARISVSQSQRILFSSHGQGAPNPRPRESCSQVIARRLFPVPDNPVPHWGSGRATNPNSNPPSPSRGISQLCSSRAPSDVCSSRTPSSAVSPTEAAWI